MRFKHGAPRRGIPLKLRQISIASICILIALIAVDYAWYRRAFHEHRSAFGFSKAPAFDTGVIPMSNILTIGIYLVATRRVRAGPISSGSRSPDWRRSSRLSPWVGPGPMA